MFSQLGDKLQDIFKDLRGHGSISETNINDALRSCDFGPEGITLIRRI